MRIFAMAVVTLVFLVLVTGCGSQAAQQASQARSSYISARAVLVGVQEFPARMENALRSQASPDLIAKAQELAASTRNLVSSANSAFTSCRQNAEKLKGSDKEYTPYAESLLLLVGMNEQVLASYSVLIGLSNSLASSAPYTGPPNDLMPALNRLDDTVKQIEQVMDRIEQQEAEAEQLYQSLTQPA
ncbi:MAG: hypothetical protein A2V52_03245 [Actinobacteria bacterium RBG_19FT_COMBO_54_7]|uniref:Lipoprotein n=1 Tax=Candidatus Solincola sediminis TaxID=1797199 RepID=A0A1F2WLM7_9ACTN|nr:MAG: hypothetical protein A2Y75_08320 [Candidatus Solincola sediminis]OFW58599.1 MAG: hypothetical protein A2W01_02605 [Candidatus Solincola sediminis]OFW65141.1 MAG: hypothetical protein A2V52_03245 [Actinobacteria bacterium RBG_19FT_COMBO_54_7]